MADPRKRSDFSRFLVHLTKDIYGRSAEENLLNILQEQVIIAKNYHCLLQRKIKDSDLRSEEKNKFKSVCFTETPLDQLQTLTTEWSGRKIKLKPYGIVFRKHKLLKSGASPAIYVNGEGTEIGRELIYEFTSAIEKVSLLSRNSTREKRCSDLAKYYSLVNVINKRHDFSWEREWRFVGDYQFELQDIAVIIANEPSQFKQKLINSFEEEKCEKLLKIAIISPEWNYEEVIDSLAKEIWNCC